MEEYGENDSSEDELDSGEPVENTQVTFQLPKQGNQVSWNKGTKIPNLLSRC